MTTVWVVILIVTLAIVAMTMRKAGHLLAAA